MIFISLTGIILIFYIIIIILTKQNKNYPKPLKKSIKNQKFAILIPARDESKVIDNLLQSIQNQTLKISMQDVYVIVETTNDPTIAICKKYNASAFIRKHLQLQRKGYALDECIKEIYSKNYDAYFIFDADNILDKDYMKEMLPIYQQGYDIGVGYRNIKNGKKILPSTSALIFSIINTIGNEMKTKDTRNITLSGTGFFINGKWIQKWKGFPFHELTEDYELYLYSIIHNMTSYYNKKSIFYDEQPNTFKQSYIQRTRWIRGYLDSRKKYKQQLFKSIQKNDPNVGSKMMELIGLLPIIIPILLDVSIIVYHLLTLQIKHILIDLFIVYIILVLLTIYIFIKEGKKLEIDPKLKWIVALYHPIFLISYVPCFFSALFHKNMQWKKIEHVENRIE